jgi:hypothetical protein
LYSKAPCLASRLRRECLTRTAREAGGAAAGGVVDGRLDIVSVHAYTTILPFFGDGTGGFVGGLRYLTGLQVQGVTAGDLDADGDVDVVVPNLQTGQVSIFRNATRP